LFDVPVVDCPMCSETQLSYTRVCVCVGVYVSDPYKTDLPKMLTQMDIGHRQ